MKAYAIMLGLYTLGLLVGYLTRVEIERAQKRNGRKR